MNFKNITSIELEVERIEWTYEKLKKYRYDLFEEFKNKIHNLRVHPDISLLNAGVEISGNLSPFNSWRNLISKLREDFFVITKRTGLHIHFDVTDVIKTIDDLHNVVQKIQKIQNNRLFNISKHLNSFHNIYPPSVIKNLLKTNSIEDFAKVYLYEFRAKKIHNIKNALMLKGLEHEHWIDISPILRYLMNCPSKSSKGYLRSSGSIELRFSLVTNQDKGRLYERISLPKIESILIDMINIRKYFRAKINF